MPSARKLSAGSVEGRSEKEAIEAAVEQYAIAERDHWRVSAQREA
jgi:hypothetical protein